jgi:hypothetical protein
MRPVALVVLAALGLALSAAPPASADGKEVAKCIKVSHEARYRGLGYNHVVIVSNVCARAADCRVSTDVNPEPQDVSVAGGSQVEVVTFLGSPARDFTPRVTCAMH